MLILQKRNRKRHRKDVRQDRRQDFLFLLKQVRQEPAEAEQKACKRRVGVKEKESE
jgi:hypothetical protein